MKHLAAGLAVLLAVLATAPVRAADDATQQHDMTHMHMLAEDSHITTMPGLLGDYGMSRDASGTSWQPDSTPMHGIMSMHDEWMTMLHGYLNQVYDRQGGPRGASKQFAESMLMGMASRSLGDGTLGLRAMLSLDPAMGRNGYPLLLQTGESADGVQPLVDRQHPHDLFMELAATYSYSLTEQSSGFAYLGYPGEPALGPATFMHRASGADIPEAPITHHWLDSTHITYGVVTLGYVWRDWKFEASAFNGREPDASRWNLDAARLDSASARITWNPSANWSLQVSRGTLHSPEALEPELNQTRTTASASYNLPLSDTDNWATTFAWGRDDNRPGGKLDGFLLESEFTLREKHTFFARAENVQNNELFGHGSPLAGEVFTVSKLSVGYIRDWKLSRHLKFGLGGLLSAYNLPATIEPAYGTHPDSWMLFARVILY